MAKNEFPNGRTINVKVWFSQDTLQRLAIEKASPSGYETGPNAGKWTGNQYVRKFPKKARPSDVTRDDLLWFIYSQIGGEALHHHFGEDGIRGEADDYHQSEERGITKEVDLNPHKLALTVDNYGFRSSSLEAQVKKLEEDRT